MSLAFAGCVESNRSPSVPAPAAVAYDDDTGAITGLIVDDSLSPLAEAEVQLDGTRQTLSAPDGTFGFSEVAPGEHVLVAFKLGFQQAQQRVDVFLREVATARISLVPVGVDEPYHETQIGVAIVGCGLGLRNQQLNSPPAGVGGLALCPSIPPAVQDATGIRDDFRVDWDAGSLANMTGIYAESQWVSTQVLGNGVRIRWYFGAEDPSQLGPFLGEKDQGSPISFRFPIEDLRFNATVDPTATASGAAGTVNAEYCLTEPCQFISMHYAGRNNLGPQYPVDFGFGFQQRVEDYLTAFYFEEFPAQFSALPDQ